MNWDWFSNCIFFRLWIKLGEISIELRFPAMTTQLISWKIAPKAYFKK